MDQLDYGYQQPQGYDPLNPGPAPDNVIPDFKSSINLNDLSNPDNLSDKEKSQIELAGKIAQANERKNRVGDLVKAAQYPYIKADMDASAAKEQALMQQIEEAQKLLQAPAPTLVQNQLSMPEILSAGLGSLLAHNNLSDVLNSAVGLSNQRNQLDFQNKSNQFNITRDNAQALIKFLQSQYLNEQQTGSNLQSLYDRTMIEDQQNQALHNWQSGENDKQRALTERDKAWSDFYHSDNEDEVRAAGQRLQKLDPANAPNPQLIEGAAQAAKGKREKEALDMWKNTVGWKISMYGGKVPDADAPGLLNEQNQIAKEFGVDPSLFGDLPTESFWKTKFEQGKLQNRKAEMDLKYKYLNEKQRDDLAVKWANVDVAKERASIAQQNANTNGARLEWQKVKGNAGDILKQLSTQKTTTEKNLAGTQSAIRRILGGKTRDQVAHDYFKQKDLKPLYNKEAQYSGQLDYINEHIAEAKDAQAQADAFTNPPQTQPQSNPGFTKKAGGMNPGETRNYQGGISVTRNK